MSFVAWWALFAIASAIGVVINVWWDRRLTKDSLSMAFVFWMIVICLIPGIQWFVALFTWGYIVFGIMPHVTVVKGKQE